MTPPIPNESLPKLSDSPKIVNFDTFILPATTNFHENDQNWRNRQFWQFRLGFIKDTEILKMPKSSILTIFTQNQLKFTLLSKLTVSIWTCQLLSMIQLRWHISLNHSKLSKWPFWWKLTKIIKNWHFLTNLSNSAHIMSTFVDDSVDIHLHTKTPQNHRNHQNLTPRPLLLNFGHSYADLSVYILVYTRKQYYSMYTSNIQNSRK